MRYLLYNPISGHGKAEKFARDYALTLAEASKLIDITEGDFSEKISFADTNDSIILFGGDGTLNSFINTVNCETLCASVWYYPAGSGNDFYTDIRGGCANEPVEITKYIHKLPVVRYQNKERRFINGVGYGIDGYCCEVGDLLRAKGKTPNYTAIAIRGLLFHYHPCSAVVTVDGVEHRYEKVWLAPTMFGGHYGGGMNPAPEQTREKRKLSVMVFHGSGKLKTLAIFPSIFEGKHTKHTKYVEILEGNEIQVKYERPTPMQIDGETVLQITEYTAYIKD